MEKNYNHLEVEKDLEQKWRNKKYFMTHEESKKPFTILLPPPNVTGKLHLGHALDVYIPDTIIRYKKLKGYDVMWIPGMDHAGIATQSKVEDVIYNQTGKTRHDLGREQFLKQIWSWKEEYASLFRKQWARVGLALDYQNERFTLDKEASEAVQKVFIDLYNKGYIYRGVKAVSWDIKLQTAISNIEVINEPTKQIMYYIKYKVKETNEDLIVATVRPETLLSDVAIVYNSKDKKYQKYQNLHVIHPLTKKVLPVIADEYVDPDFGTGLMKLSAHAEADIEIIQKLGLEIIESIDKNGIINYPNSQFNGLDRSQARSAIAKYLEENNFILKQEEVISNVCISERSKSVVEILVLPQWFVKMDQLKDHIINNMKSKDQVKFYPKRLKDTMKQWMSKIHDWNISRQIWWGHRIPAWYKDNQIKVQIDTPGEGWIQDDDVLDTWFSSGIAPFTFMGWPNETKMLERYYPTSLLVTGYDIIFFWVARMYFFGLEFIKQKPFKELLFHGLIRDEKDQKMSKSLNNGVDPMDLIEKYGSDSLRWFLLTNTTPGLDIRFSTQKIESAWRLNNKLWNIANYINSLPNQGSKTKSAYDYWILDKLSNLNKKITKLMKKYEFAIIGSEIYKFIFNYFSSWYIEFLKTTQNKVVALEILRKTLIILHPFLPFITDRIYTNLYQSELLEQKIPMLRSYQAFAEIDEVIEIVTAIRKYREEMQISKKEVIEYQYSKQIEAKWIKIINRMANAKVTQNKDLLIAINNHNLFIKQSQELKEKNKQELLDKIKYIEFEIERAQKILANDRFVQSAPADKVAAERLKLEKYTNDFKKYQKELKWKY
ncbi:valine--tRNA ligase [Mycoplasmopsis bovirhinis]|uniref:valine--tRNA ligase n=1 Tax=Mycoplasmopsis bovirhinis TaxID=29553 RepID=UPI000C05BD3E|nr:valine--tRNA ligase [Mycoplasmopsis bovirhinis]ATO30841.1 valine--tRNA ligase [Mycoplasmopsis bovirhinis]